MTKKYKIILADPPWKYNSRANHKTRFRGGACGHYNLMEMEEIKSLSINNIADDNCVLFLWVTFPYLKEQLEVFESWGFKFKTLGFAWLKTNRRNGFPFFGVGYYTKSNMELCLLGIKGRMKPITNKVSQVIIAPRQKHSEKPNQIRDKIIELFGDLPRIELFARTKREGWDSWGNEINNDIELKT
mgnify:CR=1 FL=1|tara:strand:- start:48 stop:605 length:558 start_codon:yes stop_codon:yes gene_type:complete